MTKLEIKDNFLDKFSSAIFTYAIWFILFFIFAIFIISINNEYILLILNNLYITPDIIEYISNNIKFIIP
jgi:hypothetical protein